MIACINSGYNLYFNHATNIQSQNGLGFKQKQIKTGFQITLNCIQCLKKLGYSKAPGQSGEGIKDASYYFRYRNTYTQWSTY